MALIQSWQYPARAGIAAAAVAAGGQIIALGVLSKEVEGRRTDPQAQARKNIRDIALSAQGEVVTAVSMDKIAYGFIFDTPSPPSLPETEDIYASYERGLKRLLASLPNQAAIVKALSFEQQLWENINLTRRYGDTDDRRARRSEIIDYLNQLALREIGRSFNDLCRSG